MKKPASVTIFNYASGGSGAHRAAGRLALALKAKAVPDYIGGFQPILVTASDSRMVAGSNRLSWQRNLHWRLRYLLRKTKKVIYRVFGGAALHSSASIKTGFLESNMVEKPAVIVANWFGDYSDSIEELGKVRAPLILRNGDMWWFQGSRHFANPPGVALSPWQRFLEGFFFGREDRETLQRKKKHLYPVVSATVSPSPWMMQQVIDSGHMPHAHHVTIPNPLDTAEWFPEDKYQAREHFGIRSEEFSIGFGAVGGTRDPRKGADLLMGALKNLRAYNNTDRLIRCDVFGEKGRSAITAGLPVVKHGRLGDAALRQFYSAIDVFVVPSRMEGFPNTALEALACGTPVIAFDTGPMGDYLLDGETALLARAFSADDLASKIQTAMVNPVWISHAGRKGAAWVRENLAPSVVAKQWFALLTLVLEQNRER